MRDTRQPLRAGELSHRIGIVAPAGTRAVTEQDVAIGEAAAISVLPPQFQARESLQAGGLQTATQHMVSVRYRDDLLPSDVIVEECCTQRRFQILSIVPSDRRDAIDMMCVMAG